MQHWLDSVKNIVCDKIKHNQCPWMGSSHDFDELENCETVHFALGYVSENHDGELFPAHNSVSLSEILKSYFHQQVSNSIYYLFR